MPSLRCHAPRSVCGRYPASLTVTGTREPFARPNPFDAETGLGTTERIFMDGEEVGVEGRAFAHVVTGAEAGDSFELPGLGRFSWENALANPASGAKTVVVGTDDSTPGEVYLYVGDKKATGNTIEKAGLTDGKFYGIAASFGDDTGASPQLLSSDLLLI